MSDVTDTDLLPIAALNDLLFCPRRCALHLIEQVWEDSVDTLEGERAHQRSHDATATEMLPDGGQIVRDMWLRSDRLRLIGKADVVEFRRAEDGTFTPYPIEYKYGRRRKWDNDDVQLCAQALCLEEMLGVDVPGGAVFHIQSRRRREVAFDARLRKQTETAAARLHQLVQAAVTPAPQPAARCRACSLHELCMPDSLADRNDVEHYLRGLYQIDEAP